MDDDRTGCDFSILFCEESCCDAGEGWLKRLNGGLGVPPPTIFAAVKKTDRGALPVVCWDGTVEATTGRSVAATFLRGCKAGTLCFGEVRRSICVS